MTPTTIIQRAEEFLKSNSDSYSPKWDTLKELIHYAKATAKERNKIQETLSVVEEEVAKVYDAITWGKFSKCNTDSSHVISEVEKIRKQDIEEATTFLQKELDRIHEIEAMTPEQTRVYLLDNDIATKDLDRLHYRALSLIKDHQIKSLEAKVRELENIHCVHVEKHQVDQKCYNELEAKVKELEAKTKESPFAKLARESIALTVFEEVVSKRDALQKRIDGASRFFCIKTDNGTLCPHLGCEKNKSRLQDYLDEEGTPVPEKNLQEILVLPAEETV